MSVSSGLPTEGSLPKQQTERSDNSAIANTAELQKPSAQPNQKKEQIINGSVVCATDSSSSTDSTTSDAEMTDHEINTNIQTPASAAALKTSHPTINPAKGRAIKPNPQRQPRPPGYHFATSVPARQRSASTHCVQVPLSPSPLSNDAAPAPQSSADPNRTAVSSDHSPQEHGVSIGMES